MLHTFLKAAAEQNILMSQKYFDVHVIQKMDKLPNVSSDNKKKNCLNVPARIAS